MESRAISRKVLVVLAHIVLLAPALVFAAGGGAKMEIKTAVEHAAFASKAGDVAKTHWHLHHVINCLVGPNGEGFDASAGNPCKGQGNGALNDLGGSMQEKAILDQALALAKVGVEIQGYKPASDTAMAVKSLLEEEPH